MGKLFWELGGSTRGKKQKRKKEKECWNYKTGETYGDGRNALKLRSELSPT